MAKLIVIKVSRKKKDNNAKGKATRSIRGDLIKK